MKDENKIRELSEIYENIFNNASDGILIADIKNKKFLLGNKMICEMLGYSLEEIKNLGVTDIHPEESLPNVIKHFNKMSRKGIELAKDIPVKRKDGSIFYGDIKSFPIKLSGKSYIAGIFRDTTERKLLEKDISNREEKYQSLYKEFRGILDAIPDALVLLSRDLKVVWSNEIAAKNMNMTLDNFIGQHCYKVRHGRSEPCEICPVLECFTTHKPKIVEATTPDRRVWELHVYPVLGERGEVKGAIEAAHNITERKKAEEALKKRERELQIETHNLEETNIALKVLLNRREEDKTELEDKVLLNIKGLVIPYLERLKTSGLDKSQMAYLNILESNLNEITSPFSHRLSSKFLNFTPKEIQVADLIRQGKTNKEISELVQSSSSTIAFHRENIRKKLELKGKKVNLRAYLISLT